MYQNLELFKTAGAMAHHAGMRQAMVAQNIANADTPNFKALEMPSFAEAMEKGDHSVMITSRPSHLTNDMQANSLSEPTRSSSEPAPNGNSVSIEDEILNSVDVSREHARALAIYRHGMTVLRTTLGK